MSLATRGSVQAERRFFSWVSMRLSWSRRWTSARSSSRAGSAAASGAGCRSAPSRASMAASTRSVLGRLSERAKCQACSGLSRTPGRPASREREAQRPVAAAGGLVDDHVVGSEAGHPGGDGRGLVGDPRLAAARVADVEEVLREIDADVVPCHAGLLSMSSGSRAHATVQAWSDETGGDPIRFTGLHGPRGASGFTTGPPLCHEISRQGRQWRAARSGRPERQRGGRGASGIAVGLQSVRACLAGADIAPAKGQAGAHRFVDGQIG